MTKAQLIEVINNTGLHPQRVAAFLDIALTVVSRDFFSKNPANLDQFTTLVTGLQVLRNINAITQVIAIPDNIQFPDNAKGVRAVYGMNGDNIDYDTLYVPITEHQLRQAIHSNTMQHIGNTGLYYVGMHDVTCISNAGHTGYAARIVKSFMSIEDDEVIPIPSGPLYNGLTFIDITNNLIKTGRPFHGNTN